MEFVVKGVAFLLVGLEGSRVADLIRCLRRRPAREGWWELGFHSLLLAVLFPYVVTVLNRPSEWGGDWMLAVAFVVFVGPEVVAKATGRPSPLGLNEPVRWPWRRKSTE